MVALVIDEDLRLVGQPAERAEWMMRSQSRRKALRVGLGVSGIAPAPALPRIGGIDGPRAPVSIANWPLLRAPH